MKKRIIMMTFITTLIILFCVLWFSEILPKQVAQLVASSYMNHQEDGSDYQVLDVEYSPAHDSYFVYFINQKNKHQRNIGVYYRLFPYKVYFDSNYPG